MKYKLLIGILSFCCAAGAARVSSPQPPAVGNGQEKSASGGAPHPGVAEMERLKFYLGEWDYTENYPKSAMAPNGGSNTGVYLSKLGPGGMSLLNSFHSKGPVGEFEGMLVITWDAREKAYKQYAFGSDFPGAIVETGAFEGDALVFRGEFPSSSGAVAIRNATRVREGTIESEQYISAGGAPERLLVKVVARKR